MWGLNVCLCVPSADVAYLRLRIGALDTCTIYFAAKVCFIRYQPPFAMCVFCPRCVGRLVERILDDGRSYLCGDTISMADITFASLAFPVILPEETASVFVAYDPRSLPRGYVETIKR